MKNYDFIFITHIPSFYKINLYNELSKRYKILAVFCCVESSIRKNGFVSDNFNFDFIFVSNRTLENTCSILTLLKIAILGIRLESSVCFINGWERLEFWVALFFFKNPSLVLENHEFRSNSRLSLILKRIFLSKTFKVAASGERHSKSLRSLGFKRSVIVTNGVGLIDPVRNFDSSSLFSKYNIDREKINGVYLGRYAPEKNVSGLHSIFSGLINYNYSLSVAGFDEPVLSNVNMCGYIPRNEISSFLPLFDFLVILSHQEPWGLVIEEALACGVPVVCSSACGASELITHGVNGFVVENDFDVVMRFFINRSNKNYWIDFKSNVFKFDYQSIRKSQIDSYSSFVDGHV